MHPPPSFSPPSPPVYISYPPPTVFTMAQFTTHRFLLHHHPPSNPPPLKIKTKITPPTSKKCAHISLSPSDSATSAQSNLLIQSPANKPSNIPPSSPISDTTTTTPPHVNAAFGCHPPLSPAPLHLPPVAPLSLSEVLIHVLEIKKPPTSTSRILAHRSRPHCAFFLHLPHTRGHASPSPAFPLPSFIIIIIIITIIISRTHGISAKTPASGWF